MSKAAFTNTASSFRGRKSRKLLLVSFAVLAFLIFNGIFTYYHIETTTSDSRVINYTGIIRGGSQRISKLELAGMGDDGFIGYVGGIVDDFYMDEIKPGGNDAEFKSNVDLLKEAWDEFKSTIFIYRGKQDDENRNKLLHASEKLWERANETVFSAQDLSVAKMKLYDHAMAITLVNLILMSIIVLGIKNYVRDELEFQASHDPLTKSYNRRFLYEYINREISNFRRYDGHLSVLLFDIDHFKNINDKYGHDTGDYALVELVKIIGGSIRKSDIFARFGGEEFVLVVPELDIENVKTMAERLRQGVERHEFTRIGKMTVIVGIAKYEEGDIFDSIIKRADEALYNSKKCGRNMVTVL